MHRGSKNPTLLAIGDAPSQTDDLLGKPFIDDPGTLFDEMLSLAGFSPAETAFTHVVACHTEDDRGRYRDPKRSEILKCWPRLLDLMKILKPKIIVTAGVIATKTMDLCGEDLVLDGVKPIQVSITNPGIIWRSGGTDSVAFSYAVVQLKKANFDLQMQERLNGGV